MNLKFKFFDLESKSWFQEKNNKEHCKQLVLTQNGELIFIETINGHVNITHEKDFPTVEYKGEIVPKFVKVQGTNIRDVGEHRYYIDDIVKFKDGSIGVLIFSRDGLCIGSGPFNNYTAIDPVRKDELREAERIGSIHEFPNFFDNYKAPN